MSPQDRNGQARRPGPRRTNGPRTSRPSSPDPQPVLKWVKLEHRDVDGNPSLPKELIASTHGRRYSDVPPDTEIRVIVLKGNKPNPLLLVERKIYEVHLIAVHGWRRTGRITVELPLSRSYEADWFSAMQGVKLDISDPGLGKPNLDKAEYTIKKSSFDEKVVILPAGHRGTSEVPLFEGVLDITETWRSAWHRQSAEVLSMGFKHFLLPLLIAVLAALLGLWLGRSSQIGDTPSSTAGGEESLPAGTAGSRTDALSDGAAEQSGRREPVTEPLQGESDQPPGSQLQESVNTDSDSEDLQDP